MLPVKIKLSPQARLPEYQSAASAGADVFACCDAPIIISPGGIALVPTGLFAEIPEGYEIQIRPRSGLALKNGITLLNTPGTIDPDYRGEIKIIMVNFGAVPFTVEHGMRIAQMIFNKTYRGQFSIVDELSATGRGAGGFGHTGV